METNRIHDRYCRCHCCRPPRDYHPGAFPPPKEMSAWQIALFSIAVAVGFCAFMYCATL